MIHNSKDAEWLESSFIIDGGIDGTRTLENSLVISYEVKHTPETENC